MNLSKFCSIVCSALLMGCASVPSGYQHLPKGVFTDNTGKVFLSTMDTKTLDHMFSKSDATPEMQQAKMIREYYCRNSMQRRAIKYDVKLVLPKAKAGLPVDEASKILDVRMKYSRILVKHLFTMATSDELPSEHLNIAIPTGGALLTGKDLIETGKLERIDRPFNDHNLNYDPASLEKKNEQELLYTIFTIGGSGYRDDAGRRLIRQSIDDGILFVLDRSENVFIVVTDNRVYDMTSPGHEAHGKMQKLFGLGFRIPRTLEAPSQILTKHSRARSPHVFFILADETSETEVKPSGTQVVQPLKDARQFELSFLARNYALILPAEVQTQLFGRPLYGLDDRSNENIIEKALNDSSKTWAHYVAAASTIKESPTSDPQIYNFQIELQLDTFCKYGRAKTDLLSQ